MTYTVHSCGTALIGIAYLIAVIIIGGAIDRAQHHRGELTTRARRDY